MTSQEPFAGKSEQVVILDVMVRKAIPTRPAGPILPQSDQGDRLWDLLKQCWSYDPSSRPSANQVHTAVSSWDINPILESTDQKSDRRKQSGRIDQSMATTRAQSPSH